VKKIALIAVALVALVSLSVLVYGIEARQAADVVSIRVSDALPLTDPHSQLWSKATEFQLPMGN